MSSTALFAYVALFCYFILLKKQKKKQQISELKLERERKEKEESQKWEGIKQQQQEKKWEEEDTSGLGHTADVWLDYSYFARSQSRPLSAVLII